MNWRDGPRMDPADLRRGWNSHIPEPDPGDDGEDGDPVMPEPELWMRCPKAVPIDRCWECGATWWCDCEEHEWNPGVVPVLFDEAVERMAVFMRSPDWRQGSVEDACRRLLAAAVGGEGQSVEAGETEKQRQSRFDAEAAEDRWGEG